MNACCSIFLSGTLLWAGIAGAEDREPQLLRLALAPQTAEEMVGVRWELPPPVELDIAAWEGTEAEEQSFFPHASQVRLETREVNAHELLKREMFRMHGSVSIGVDSRGGWVTSVELHRNLTPYLELGIGLSIGRGRRWWDWD
jgi:hypothetical protein